MTAVKSVCNTKFSMFSTLEILFLFLKKEFREGTYTPQGGTKMSPVYRGLWCVGYNLQINSNQILIDNQRGIALTESELDRLGPIHTGLRHFL